MSKFIEIHGTLVNVEEIRKVDFVSDDIYLGLFPKAENGEICVDYITFVFAEIHLFAGEKICLEIDLYPPEDGMDEDVWIALNRSYINKSMEALKEAFEKITTVTGFEYRDI